MPTQTTVTAMASETSVLAMREDRAEGTAELTTARWIPPVRKGGRLALDKDIEFDPDGQAPAHIV